MRPELQRDGVYALVWSNFRMIDLHLARVPDTLQHARQGQLHHPHNDPRLATSTDSLASRFPELPPPRVTHLHLAPIVTLRGAAPRLHCTVLCCVVFPVLPARPWSLGQRTALPYHPLAGTSPLRRRVIEPLVPAFLDESDALRQIDQQTTKATCEPVLQTNARYPAPAAVWALISRGGCPVSLRRTWWRQTQDIHLAIVLFMFAGAYLGAQLPSRPCSAVDSPGNRPRQSLQPESRLQDPVEHWASEPLLQSSQKAARPLGLVMPVPAVSHQGPLLANHNPRRPLSMGSPRLCKLRYHSRSQPARGLVQPPNRHAPASGTTARNRPLPTCCCCY